MDEHQSINRGLMFALQGLTIEYPICCDCVLMHRDKKKKTIYCDLKHDGTVEGVQF